MTEETLDRRLPSAMSPEIMDSHEARDRLLLLAISCAVAQDNVLSPEDKKSGWSLLFDGKTMKNWQDRRRRTCRGQRGR
jgi:hypothetical protein